MTLGAVVAVWWPLARRQGPVRSGSDIAVYRDQLDEIHRDQAASLIGNVEAEAARVEVSRRLIAAAETAKAISAAPAPGLAGWYRRGRRHDRWSAWHADHRRWLLVLDTVPGENGHRVYKRAGWTETGIIPDYALFPDGRLCDTAIRWKRLDG